jgi:hypothetical protein
LAPGPIPAWIGFTTVGAGPIGEFAGGSGTGNALEGIADLLTSIPGPTGLPRWDEVG